VPPLLRVLGGGFEVAVSVGGTVGSGILRTPGAVTERCRRGCAPLTVFAWIEGF